jgi:hypothetical protein
VTREALSHPARVEFLVATVRCGDLVVSATPTVSAAVLGEDRLTTPSGAKPFRPECRVTLGTKPSARAQLTSTRTGRLESDACGTKAYERSQVVSASEATVTGLSTDTNPGYW